MSICPTLVPTCGLFVPPLGLEDRESKRRWRRPDRLGVQDLVLQLPTPLKKKKIVSKNTIFHNFHVMASSLKLNKDCIMSTKKKSN